MSSKLGDLYYDLKLETKNLRKSVDKAEKQINRLGTSVNKQSKHFEKLSNSLVRHVRQLETLYVAYKSIETVTVHLIGKGIELNRMYEDQSLGIAALITAKTKMYDANNKELNGYDKFVTAQKLTLGVMDDIKKAALETPASFQQMIGFYQQSIGYAISKTGYFGKSLKEVNKNVIEFTQRMSALGAAIGMPMDRLDEEIRSLMSGNASSDSNIAKILFGSPAAANQAVKEARKHVNGLSDLLLDKLKVFEQVQGVDTFTKSLNKMYAAFDDIRRMGTGIIFQDIKNVMDNITSNISGNMDDIIDKIDTLYVILKTQVLAEMESWNEIFTQVKKSLFEIVAIIDTTMSSVLKGVGLIKDDTKSLGDAVKEGAEGWNVWINYLVILQKGMEYLAAGMATVTNAFYQAHKLEIMAKQKLGLGGESLSDTEKAQLANISKVPEAQRTAYQSKLLDELLQKKKESAKTSAEIAALDAKIAENRKAIMKAGTHSLADIKKEFAIKMEAAKTERERAKLKKEEADAITKNIKIQMQGTEAQIKSNKKTAAALDKQKKLQQQINAELQKQALLREKIDNITGKNGIRFSSQELENAKKKYELAKKLVTDNKKLIVGRKSRLAYEKSVTKAMEAQYTLLQKMTQEMNKWQGVFTSIFNGDFASAINSAFSSVFDGLKTATANMFGGIGTTLGGLAGGFMGSAIGFGVDLIGKALGGLFSSGKVWTPEEWQKAEGIQNSPETENIVKLLESMDWSMTRELHYSKGIFDNLSMLVKESGRAAVALSGSFDYSPKSSASSGFLGFSSRESQTLSSGLELLYSLGRVNAQNVVTTQTTKSSWWGLRKKTTTETSRTPVDNEAYRAIQNAYKEGINAVVKISTALGNESAEAIARGFRGSLHKLNFEGKSSDDIAAMISGAIGADLDTLLSRTVSWIGEFKKAGESWLEAGGRLVYEGEQVQVLFAKLGNTFNDLNRNTVSMSQSFIEASGGIETALGNVNSYIDNFYTDAEKKQLAIDTLNRNGMTLYSSVDEYKAAVRELNDLTVSTNSKIYAEQLAQLLRMQGLYKEYFDYIDKSESDYLSRLEDAYTGNLSYLNSIEKAKVLGVFAQKKLENGDTQGYFDSLYKQLEYEKKMSTTREEYAWKFDEYIRKVGEEGQPKTLNDVVSAIDELLEQDKKIEDAIIRSSLQKPL